MLDFVVFTGTDAGKVTSYMLIIGFVLVSLTVFYGIYALISLSRLYGLRVRYQRTLALYSTVVIGILVALQSVGQLGVRDIWVLLPLSVLGYLYSAYARASSRNLGS